MRVQISPCAPKDFMKDEILTVTQIAELLKLTPTTIYRLIKTKQLPIRRILLKYRILKSELFRSLGMHKQLAEITEPIKQPMIAKPTRLQRIAKPTPVKQRKLTPLTAPPRIHTPKEKPQRSKQIGEMAF
jgi:excisionase family DNA binding protein